MNKQFQQRPAAPGAASEYKSALRDAMAMLARQHDTIFIGQAVAYPGTAMFETLVDVPMDRRVELPVMEDSQLGMSIGLALSGFLPISIYPRMNFLLLAVNQLVNHLDKLPLYGNGYMPKVIVRTAVASDHPLDPGPQHLGDFSSALLGMMKTVNVIKLNRIGDVIPVYRRAMESEYSTVVVEMAEMY